jgi:hypothetical protein
LPSQAHMLEADGYHSVTWEWWKKDKMLGLLRIDHQLSNL